MANTVLNPSIIAKAAVRILDNELVMANRVFRAYESEFSKKVNGYEAGDTISIRKPNQFTVRSANVGAGAVPTAAPQDVTEGKLTMQVGTQSGVDFKFSSAELTLKIEELAERVIKPAMVQLANRVDRDVMALYTQVPTWLGAANTVVDSPVNSFAKFAQATQRMDEMGVPSDDRSAVFAPDSWWALAGSQTVLFPTGIANPAYRTGEIGRIGAVDTYMSQNVPTFTSLATDNLGTVTGTQSTTYAAVLNTESVPGTMSLVTAGWGATDVIKAGTVFTIANVFAINPVTKVKLPFLQHFTVMVDSTCIAGVPTPALVISPAIIPFTGTEAFATTDSAAIGAAVITCAGAVGGAYRQNLVFHKNAFALAVVPLIKPPGAVDVARESYKGLSVRVIPYYDGPSDVSTYRLDILYGVKTVDPRLAVRLTGGATSL